MTTLTAEGLLLREWQDSDATALVEIHGDPAMRRWTRKPVTTPEEAAAWVAAQQEGWEANTTHSFAVPDAEEASCRVAEKSGSPLKDTLPTTPPWPLPGHLHVRAR